MQDEFAKPPSFAGKKAKISSHQEILAPPPDLIDRRVRFTEKHQTTFDENGNILLPRFLSRAGLEFTRKQIDKILHGESTTLSHYSMCLQNIRG
jgi:hypothetical protein